MQAKYTKIILQSGTVLYWEKLRSTSTKITCENLKKQWLLSSELSQHPAKFGSTLFS